MRVVIDDNEIVKYNQLLVWQGVCDILCEKNELHWTDNTYTQTHIHSCTHGNI